MKEERIMSFQMSKKLGQIDLDKVSGGSDRNMSFPNLPNLTYGYDDSGFHVTFDK